MRAPSELRAGNVASLVGALRQHGDLSRTELARVTGLSRTTVLSILEQLERSGFVAVRASNGAGRSALGRPAARVALRPAAGVALGVAVGREQMELLVTDLSLTVLAQRHARFPLGTPAEPLIDLAVELATAATDEAGVGKELLVGAVLGLSSPIDPATGDPNPRVLKSWAARPFRETLAQRLGTPVQVENDANLEAWAEMTLGAGRGLRHALYVHAGWGIGGAVVLDGALRRGPAGAAGEIAHIRVPGAGGPVCRCGRRGCVLSLASGREILRALAVTHGPELDLDRVVALALDGDPAATRALTDAGDAIGVALAGLCTTMNPEAVIVGGRLGVPGSPLVDAARRRIQRDVHRTIGAVLVRPAELGAAGGALGAASLVVRSGDVFGHRVEAG